MAVYMQPEMFVLDRDDEFIAWRGSAPDFHPRLGVSCTLDPNVVYVRVQQLLTRIDGQPRTTRTASSGVPGNMARAFLGMYRAQLAALQRLPPPLSAAQQAQIAVLQQKIQILQDFLARLN